MTRLGEEVEHANSEEEEEEEEDDAPVRRGGAGGFRLIQDSGVQQSQQSAAGESERAPATPTASQPRQVPTSPNPATTTPAQPGTPPATKVTQQTQQAPPPPQQQQQQGQSDEELKRQQWIQQQQELVKQKQQEAMERAREEALKAHAEAKARAEAARQQQLQQLQAQQGQAQQQQKVQQTQQVQQVQQVQQQQSTQRPGATSAVTGAPPQAQQQSQRPVPPPQPQQQQAKQPAPVGAVPPQQQKVLQPAGGPGAGQAQQSQQQGKVGTGIGGAAPAPPRTPEQRQPPGGGPPQQPVNRQANAAPVPSLGPPKQVLVKSTIQPRSLGGLVNQRPPGEEPPPEEAPQLGSAPKHKLLSDEAWQQQQRVPADYPAVQPERLQVADFLHESETRPSVIAPVVLESTKVKWNEFPEEPVLEPQKVPKVKAQEWEPVNDSEHPVIKTNYSANRNTRQWPPPGYGEEEQIELGRAAATKTTSDVGWITNPTGELVQNGDAGEGGAVGNAPWRSQVSKAGIRERQWPPPEFVWEAEQVQGSRLAVQWPPPGEEEREQQSVEVLQTHLPPKAQGQGRRQWPPPEPEYQLVPRKSAVLDERVGAPGEGPETTTTITGGSKTTTTTRVVQGQPQQQQQQQKNVQFAQQKTAGVGPGGVKSPPPTPQKPAGPGGVGVQAVQQRGVAG